MKNILKNKTLRWTLIGLAAAFTLWLAATLIQLQHIDSGPYPAGLDSPFLAAILAHRLGYDDIVLFGVDFTGHTLAQDPATQARILQNYELLRMNLAIRGARLRVISRKSRLAAVIPFIRD